MSKVTLSKLAVANPKTRPVPRPGMVVAENFIGPGRASLVANTTASSSTLPAAICNGVKVLRLIK